VILRDRDIGASGNRESGNRAEQSGDRDNGQAAAISSDWIGKRLRTVLIPHQGKSDQGGKQMGKGTMESGPHPLQQQKSFCEGWVPGFPTAVWYRLDSRTDCL